MNFPEHDEAAYQQRVDARRAERLRLDKVGGFRPVSLGDWMRLCQWASVPSVAALSLGSADLDSLLRFDEPEHAARAKPFYEAMKARMAELGAGWMARWDCCSMAEVKYRLSNGEADWDPELADLYADDLRAYDIMWEFPGDQMTAWARPWTTFATLAGYPIEYRVFVERSRIIGVSNYYPQRPLPDDAETAADVERAKVFTQRLIDTQNRPLICPEIGAVEGQWFTADFARLPSGALVFLEGGPPHTTTWGAHPCCFESGDVAGVALRDRTGKHEIAA